MPPLGGTSCFRGSQWVWPKETKMVVVDTGRFAYGSYIPRNRLPKPLAMYNLQQDPAPRRTKTMLRNCIILPAPSALTV